MHKRCDLNAWKPRALQPLHHIELELSGDGLGFALKPVSGSHFNQRDVGYLGHLGSLWALKDQSIPSETIDRQE